MWVIVAFPFMLLAVLVVWDLAAKARRRSARASDADPERRAEGDRYHAPEAERRRRLDLSASRWLGPRGWG
jgi:hypothetical protein